MSTGTKNNPPEDMQKWKITYRYESMGNPDESIIIELDHLPDTKEEKAAVKKKIAETNDLKDPNMIIILSCRRTE